MASVRRLLSHGFYPFELPPPFSSRSFANVGLAKGAPREFALQKAFTFKAAECAKHNLARKAKLRRVLSIANPVVYHNMVREIVDGWTELEAHMQTSSITITRVAFSPAGSRALSVEHSPPDFPRLRARFRTNRKYLLIADILQCYPSLYTHSIPWALHGKRAAKGAKRDWKLLGNRLDFWVRQCQDQQTRGIPIGPDTSRLIGEIVLAGVDAELQRAIPNLHGFRAIDDFELSFKTRSEAEAALSQLQSVLADYELQLNEQKTGIVELPVALDSTWPAKLRDLEFSHLGTRRRIGSLTDFFSLAFVIAKEERSESVLRYAIARTSGSRWGGATWQTYQDLLLQCATAEPGVLQNVVPELRKYQDRGESLNVDRVSELAEVTIEQHAPLGHGSEVLWALWMLVSLNLSFPAGVEAAVSSFEDPLVPLVALHGREKGLAPGLDTTAWEALMTTDNLWGRNWLLAYEAGVRKWLPTQGRKKHHVDADPAFKYLNSRGVRFYSTTASALQTKPKWRSNMPLAKMIGYGI